MAPIPSVMQSKAKEISMIPLVEASTPGNPRGQNSGMQRAAKRLELNRIMGASYIVLKAVLCFHVNVTSGQILKMNK